MMYYVSQQNSPSERVPFKILSCKVLILCPNVQTLCRLQHMFWSVTYTIFFSHFFMMSVCFMNHTHTHSYVLPYIWKYLNVSSSPNELSSATVEFKGLMKKLPTMQHGHMFRRNPRHHHLNGNLIWTSCKRVTPWSTYMWFTHTSTFVDCSMICITCLYIQCKCFNPCFWFPVTASVTGKRPQRISQ